MADGRGDELLGANVFPSQMPTCEACEVEIMEFTNLRAVCGQHPRIASKALIVEF